MIKTFKYFVWFILNNFRIGAFFQLYLSSALMEEGWFKSYYSKKAVDKFGAPIPWLTYSFIHFINRRLTKEMSIFEYGAGNSTIWFAQRVKKIISVENDEKWVEALKPSLPSNSELVVRNIDDMKYAKASLERNEKYDVIIIDGRDRTNCTMYCLNALNEKGIIIFDNTQVEDYAEAIQFIINNGFRKIDFTGTLPIVAYNNTTTIFYRTNNCLNI